MKWQPPWRRKCLGKVKTPIYVHISCPNINIEMSVAMVTTTLASSLFYLKVNPTDFEVLVAAYWQPLSIIRSIQSRLASFALWRDFMTQVFHSVHYDRWMFSQLSKTLTSLCWRVVHEARRRTDEQSKSRQRIVATSPMTTLSETQTYNYSLIFPHINAVEFILVLFRNSERVKQEITTFIQCFSGWCGGGGGIQKLTKTDLCPRY